MSLVGPPHFSLGSESLLVAYMLLSLECSSILTSWVGGNAECLKVCLYLCNLRMPDTTQQLSGCFP